MIRALFAAAIMLAALATAAIADFEALVPAGGLDDENGSVQALVPGGGPMLNQTVTSGATGRSRLIQ